LYRTAGCQWYTHAMTLDTLIILTGTFVAVLPFLGFPNSWDNVLFFVAGAFTVLLGIVVRRRSGVGKTSERRGPFVENAPLESAGVERMGHEA